MSSWEANLFLDILISGYCRRIEKKFKLFIANDINQIIYKLYPILLFKFGDHNKIALNVSDDGTILKGNGPQENQCNGFLCYADLGQYSDTGLKQGIHLWSIKSLVDYESQWSVCFSTIGVTTEKNDKLINEWNHNGDSEVHWISTGFSSYHEECYDFKSDVVVTIKLNCNEWTVTYYKDKEQFKKEKIEPNQCYYLAMLVCCESDLTHFKVVESMDV